MENMENMENKKKGTEGRPKLSDDLIRVQFQLHKNVLKGLSDLAILENKTRTDLVRTALKQYLIESLKEKQKNDAEFENYMNGLSAVVEKNQGLAQ